jgi:hypothetical protein
MSLPLIFDKKAWMWPDTTQSIKPLAVAMYPYKKKYGNPYIKQNLDPFEKELSYLKYLSEEAAGGGWGRCDMCRLYKYNKFAFYSCYCEAVSLCSSCCGGGRQHPKCNNCPVCN